MKQFPNVDLLVQLVCHRAPVPVAAGRDLSAALQYDNHASTFPYERELWRKIRDDVRHDRAFVFPARAATLIDRLRVSPVGSVQKPAKLRFINDLRFSG